MLNSSASWDPSAVAEPAALFASTSTWTIISWFLSGAFLSIQKVPVSFQPTQTPLFLYQPAQQSLLVLISPTFIFWFSKGQLPLVCVTQPHNLTLVRCVCVCMCACACFLSDSCGCLSYNQPVPSLSDWAVLPPPCSVRVTSHCKGGCNMGVSYMLRERKKMIDFGKDWLDSKYIHAHNT